ncbi:type IV secretory system conjugative DNA transfer family protein [Methylocystis sp. H4A]|uniref:type IV secretory system conjugative DNA transfer family protein n=1 Tax=Methylocystis sp. H4A TaxID=2785788 RepID=UPI0032B165CF
MQPLHVARDLWRRQSQEISDQSRRRDRLYAKRARRPSSSRNASERRRWRRRAARGLGAFSNRSRSETISDHRRPLLLPQELKLTPKAKAFVLMAGVPPILSDKLVY